MSLTKANFIQSVLIQISLKLDCTQELYSSRAFSSTSKEQCSRTGWAGGSGWGPARAGPAHGPVVALPLQSHSALWRWRPSNQRAIHCGTAGLCSQQDIQGAWPASQCYSGGSISPACRQNVRSCPQAKRPISAFCRLQTGSGHSTAAGLQENMPAASRSAA